MRDFSWWYFNVLNELKVPHASSSLGGANTSLNSFDKPSVEVQSPSPTDDWVFIKIRFSNPPAGRPPGKVSKKQDRAILPKYKLLVYVSRS